MDEERLANILLVARRKETMQSFDFRTHRAVVSGSDEHLALLAEDPCGQVEIGTEVAATTNPDGTLAFSVVVVFAKSQPLEKVVDARLAGLGVNPFDLDVAVKS